MDEFKTKPIYTEFDMCVAKVEGWRQGNDCRVSDTLNYIKNQFDHLTKEQMKLVFEEVESGFTWDIEKDDIKHEDDEESDEEKGCVNCGSAPRHNQTDPDGSYLCLNCEDEEDEEDDTMVCSCGYEGPCDTFEYIPSEEDEKEQKILGEDFCPECYKKNEKYKFVESIPSP